MIRVAIRVVKGEIEGRWHSSLRCKSECSESSERRGIGGWNESEEKSIQAGGANRRDDFVRIGAVRHQTIIVKGDVLSGEFRAMFFDPAERRRRVARVERRNEN